MATATKPVYWIGDAPVRCDGCEAAITATFNDMRSSSGPWGNFCETCAILGPGCGIWGMGFGQQYTKQENGKWLKTKG